MRGFDFVAILGRGIQRLSPDGPWVLTEDLEVCDTDSAHLAVRVPVDDTNPLSMIGGGEMNLLAGYHLIEEYNPSLAVCAYGDRSKYLKSIAAPSESEVMSEMLAEMLSYKHGHSPEIAEWSHTREMAGPANTRQELINIFDLALNERMDNVAIVTIGVHVPRTATFISMHMGNFRQYRDLRVVLFESEEVLLRVDREKYASRVDAMRNSASFQRNLKNEMIGIDKVVRDIYGDNKPLVAV